MCGIFGMTANRDVVRTTVERLAVMEYRGYDSYGVAALTSSGFTVSKDVGSISKALRDGRFDALPSANLALGHTRWATHGGVTAANAHPHLSYDGTIAVVHNGVIANHARIRRMLEADGIEFASQTDTEVAAHLIARYVAEGSTLIDAIAAVTTELGGEYALGIISTREPRSVYGAKRKSPLVVSHNGSQAMLASDQVALAGIGEEVIFLEEGDIVRLTPDGAEIFVVGQDKSAEQVQRESTHLATQHQVADKSGYPHFMIKEIHETPVAAATAIAMPAAQFAGVIPADTSRRITLVGAGSAFYVAQIGQYLLAELARIRAFAVPSDEAENLALLRPSDSLLCVSQSGETFDTLEVCRAAVDVGAVVTSISNVPDSTQERLATHRLQQASGPEVCVLSTKSIVSQVLLLARIALEAGHANGTTSPEQYRHYQASLARLPDTLRGFLADSETAIHEVAKEYSHVEDWFFIGRGILYPVACESALKFKEVSYRHAEGTAAGFFKHGTISLIDEDFYTVALLPSPSAAAGRYAATLAAVSEIAARGGPVIGLGPSGIDEDDLRVFRHYLPLPYHGDNVADVILQLVAGQLLAYYCAFNLGREIDQPRSLAKSVTVR
jgi:glucosamine--fructose-6-phosphate aminotransferase (isomerizing)